MAILGLILILVAAAFIASALYALPKTAGMIEWNFFGTHVQTSALTVFLLGVATVVLLGLGLWMLLAGMRRSARKAAELRTLKKEQKAQAKADAERERRERAHAEASASPLATRSQPAAPDRTDGAHASGGTTDGVGGTRPADRPTDRL